MQLENKQELGLYLNGLKKIFKKNKMKKKFKIVLLSTDNVDSKFAMFIKTKDVWGKSISNPKLNISDNETYIRNIKLMSEGRAATNAQDDYDFMQLHIISDDKIILGDWYVHPNGDIDQYSEREIKLGG